MQPLAGHKALHTRMSWYADAAMFNSLGGLLDDSTGRRFLAFLSYLSMYIHLLQTGALTALWLTRSRILSAKATAYRPVTRVYYLTQETVIPLFLLDVVLLIHLIGPCDGICSNNTLLKLSGCFEHPLTRKLIVLTQVPPWFSCGQSWEQDWYKLLSELYGRGGTCDTCGATAKFSNCRYCVYCTKNELHLMSSKTLFPVAVLFSSGTCFPELPLPFTGHCAPPFP